MATYDVAAIRARVDLLALVSPDTQLRKVATTRGGEWAGACPWCGGTDRFRVQPERGQWHCRQCSPDERWQDAIAYAMRRDGVDFREACDRLAGGAALSTIVNKPHAAPAAAAEPSDTWRAAGMALVEEAEASLWGEAGRRARLYLHDRGLSKHTIRTWRLGYIAQDRYDAAEVWGADPAERQRVLVPAGIVIPWFHEGQLWQLKVRRRTGSDPKYLAVAGGHPLGYGLHTLKGHRIAVACEGEFDAMLAQQEAGELMGVVTLGSCSKGLDARVVPHLLPLARVLVAYDADEEGQKGAARLVSLSARMRQIHVPDEANDITEYWQQGGDVLGWLTEEVGTHWPAEAGRA